MGHTVVGVEFVESAIEQFFQEQKINFSAKQLDDFKCFTVTKNYLKIFFLGKKFVNFYSKIKSEDGKIRLYNGDFFKFTK